MNFLAYLVEPNSRDLFLSLFDGDVIIYDPRFGRFDKSNLDKYYNEFQQIIDGRESKVVLINKIAGNNGLVEEWILKVLHEDRPIELPIAICFDHAKKESEIRVYYSNYPIDSTHRVRSAMLDTKEHLAIPGPVARYQKALAEGDLTATLNSFEAKATVREPSGGEFIASGKSGLKIFYSFLYSFGGGAPLDHCNVVDNGQSCAIEYNIVQVGKYTYDPPQAGIAIYDYNENKLTAARIYDDFEPPAVEEVE